jgi:hypothetical protein
MGDVITVKVLGRKGVYMWINIVAFGVAFVCLIGAFIVDRYLFGDIGTKSMTKYGPK